MPRYLSDVFDIGFDGLLAVGPGRLGFLALAIATHAVVGATLAYAVGSRPLVGAVGGTFADVDLLFPATLGFPFVHRGLTHTPVVLVAAVLVCHALRGRKAALGLGVGYLSHLLLDTLTTKGILWFYPLSTVSIGGGFPVHAWIPTAVLWIGSGLLYLARARRS